ncbi:MAG: redoxin domain-containing protein, partial [Candidatus Hydrogenedentes bacterium]|nr:redoxin domain-containing protein [Candidatus Hydrogenedentota bacterium]
KNALIAFYPKAYTPVCTSEMCGFRDDFAHFRDIDTEVVAVSLDKQDKSDQFKHDKELPFNVVGDPEGKIVRAFGVSIVHLPIGEAAKRSVFLVDKQEAVRYVDAAYDIKSGKESLYKAMEALKGKAKS